jgi:predicted O-methyltransferase YrrM
MSRQWPNWFTGGYAERSFDKHLAEFSGKPALRFLQIGAYCGDASLWLLENVLTNSTSVLHDVDTWQGSQETAHGEIDFAEVFAYYRRLMAPFGNVAWMPMTSDEFFDGPYADSAYDFIYIDGSHQSHQVLRDAVNADLVLRPGGIIAFDDYQWREYEGHRNVPRPAVDAFIRCFEDQYEVLEVGLQVWMRKR